MNKIAIKVEGWLLSLIETDLSFSSILIDENNESLGRIFEIENFTFKIPFTKENQELLGVYYPLNNYDKFKTKEAKLFVNDELFFKGFLEVERVVKNDNNLEIEVRFKSIKFYVLEKLQERTMADLEYYVPYTFFNDSIIGDYRMNTLNELEESKIRIPLISYGNFFKPKKYYIYFADNYTNYTIEPFLANDYVFGQPLPTGTFRYWNGGYYEYINVGQDGEILNYNDLSLSLTGRFDKNYDRDNDTLYFIKTKEIKTKDFNDIDEKTQYTIEDIVPSFTYIDIINQLFREIDRKVSQDDLLNVRFDDLLFQVKDEQLYKDFILPFNSNLPYPKYNHAFLSKYEGQGGRIPYNMEKGFYNLTINEDIAPTMFNNDRLSMNGTSTIDMQRIGSRPFSNMNGSGFETILANFIYSDCSIYRDYISESISASGLIKQFNGFILQPKSKDVDVLNNFTDGYTVINRTVGGSFNSKNTLLLEDKGNEGYYYRVPETGYYSVKSFIRVNEGNGYNNMGNPSFNNPSNLSLNKDGSFAPFYFMIVKNINWSDLESYFLSNPTQADFDDLDSIPFDVSNIITVKQIIDVDGRPKNEYIVTGSNPTQLEISLNKSQIFLERNDKICVIAVYLPDAISSLKYTNNINDWLVTKRMNLYVELVTLEIQPLMYNRYFKLDYIESDTNFTYFGLEKTNAMNSVYGNLYKDVNVQLYNIDYYKSFFVNKLKVEGDGYVEILDVQDVYETTIGGVFYVFIKTNRRIGTETNKLFISRNDIIQENKVNTKDDLDIKFTLPKYENENQDEYYFDYHFNIGKNLKNVNQASFLGNFIKLFNLQVVFNDLSSLFQLVSYEDYVENTTVLESNIFDFTEINNPNDTDGIISYLKLDLEKEDVEPYDNSVRDKDRNGNLYLDLVKPLNNVKSYQLPFSYSYLRTYKVPTQNLITPNLILKRDLDLITLGDEMIFKPNDEQDWSFDRNNRVLVFNKTLREYPSGFKPVIFMNNDNILEPFYVYEADNYADWNIIYDERSFYKRFALKNEGFSLLLEGFIKSNEMIRVLTRPFKIKIEDMLYVITQVEQLNVETGKVILRVLKYK